MSCMFDNNCFFNNETPRYTIIFMILSTDIELSNIFYLYIDFVLLNAICNFHQMFLYVDGQDSARATVRGP